MKPNGPDDKNMKAVQPPAPLARKPLPLLAARAPIAGEKTVSPLAEGPAQPIFSSGNLELDAILKARGYTLLGTIGEGGMGKVYKAHSASLDIDVAVKTLSGDAVEDSDIRNRFINEARAMVKIRHQNIVGVFDLVLKSETKGPICIVMEFTEGSRPYSDVIDQGGPLQLKRTLRIFDQICDGLMKAHKAGIVHRDIKSANILIVPDEGEDNAKLIDFGISKVKNAVIRGKTKTGTIMGTPDYISPEQARGEDLDYRTDIYSLGVVMYEGLGRGALPFRAKEMHALLLKIISEPPQPLPAGIAPPEIIDIIMRCLEKDPADRPSLNEIKAAIAASLELKSAAARASVTPTTPQAGVQRSTEPEIQIFASAPLADALQGEDTVLLSKSASPTMGPFSTDTDILGRGAQEKRKPVSKTVMVALGGLALVAGLSLSVPLALKKRDAVHQRASIPTLQQVTRLPAIQIQEPLVDRPQTGNGDHAEDAGAYVDAQAHGSAVSEQTPTTDAAIRTGRPSNVPVRPAQQPRRIPRQTPRGHDPNAPDWGS